MLLYPKCPRFSSMGLATLVVILATAMALLTPLGCASATTRAKGPAASATHETGGVTKTRRIEIRVRPRDGETQRRRDEVGEGGEVGGAGVSPPGAALPCDAEGEREDAKGESGRESMAIPSPVRFREFIAMLAIGQVQQDREIPAVLRDAIEAAKAQGVDVELVIDEYEQSPPTKSTLTESPAELSTSSDEAALGFKNSLRRFDLPWGGRASGGGFGFEAKLLGGRGVNILHLVGAAVMALAVIPLLRMPRRWTAAAVFAGAGLAIAMTGTLIDSYPWVTLLAAFALLGLLAYGAYEAWRRGRVSLALDAITPVVEAHPMGEQLKGLIGQKAGKAKTAVKAETTASKKRAG